MCDNLHMATNLALDDHLIEAARQAGDAAKAAALGKEIKNNRTLWFNNQLDAVVAGLFMLMVLRLF